MVTSRFIPNCTVGNTFEYRFDRIVGRGFYRGGVYRAGNRSRLCRAAADPAHRRHLHARGDPDLGARSGGHVDLLHPAEGAGGRRAQGLRLDARRGARAPGGKLHAAGRRGRTPHRP